MLSLTSMLIVDVRHDEANVSGDKNKSTKATADDLTLLQEKS